MYTAVIDFIKTGSVVMNFTVNEVAAALGAELVAGCAESAERHVTGFSTDSRSVAEGELFFAINGEKFDAHAFIPEAAKQGAVAVVVERTDIVFPDGLVVLKVADTVAALGQMAAHIRASALIPFIGISGTTGKTTTKEMVAAILARSRKVLKTDGNKNNLIGVPLTLFRLTAAHQAAVVELGISEPFEMGRLVKILKPDVALITNIGAGHLETLGDKKGVAEAKSALLTDPAAECVRIVNLDDELVGGIFGSTAPGTVAPVTYSLNGPSDVFVSSSVVLEDLQGIEVEYNVRGALVSVTLKSPAACNVINGAAAIATTLALDVTLGDIKEGLEEFSAVNGRFNVTHSGGVTVIDDTYNANPDSMEAALQTLASAKGRKVAVVGDMLELGEASQNTHAAVGTRAAELGVDVVVAVGCMADTVIKGALLSGIRTDALFSFKNKEAAADAIEGLLRAGDTVLVKASRGMGLETLVEKIKERAKSSAATNFKQG